ncbi:uncharacterized protein [Montipora capricornis]|uniref:uncharacterized protein n=1 Tax=Montipora capricornis TaxID=246305 RepID=UPI0035F169F4
MVQLVALCKTSLISTYGMNRILQPFMRDLSFLESDCGVNFHLEGQDRLFRGSIGPFSDDNLGAHSIGGFVESFTSLRICRVCMATSNDIQTQFTENQFQLRTRAAHDRHCQLVQADPTLVSAYGVKRTSILNQSRYFHVVDGLDHDVMHDQLEGVLPLQIKLLLRKCIREEEYFTLETLNDRIATFDYGSPEMSNKPSAIKQQALSNDSASLSQTAAQMWCLARMLPILVGDLIPDGDENWENFLCLLRIEEIVFSPVASTRLAAYLAVLVEQYLDEFKELHDRPLIPKHHNMVHYPRQIIRRGPLVRNWVMRFEAKHNYFKKLVDKINNFKNITYSLAKRHQALQAYLLQASAGNFLRNSLEVGPGVKSTVGDSGLKHELQEIDPSITEESMLTRTSWAKVFGTKYTRGSVIVIALYHAVPVFGKVDQVFVVNGKW